MEQQAWQIVIFFFFFYDTSRRILMPRPGIGPVLLAGEGPNLKPLTTREVLRLVFLWLSVHHFSSIHWLKLSSRWHRNFKGLGGMIQLCVQVGRKWFLGSPASTSLLGTFLVVALKVPLPGITFNSPSKPGQWVSLSPSLSLKERNTDFVFLVP